ncbi:MAG: hypothetical protein ACW97X_10200 [Candidatus Hodarchaeales archaeon]
MEVSAFSLFKYPYTNYSHRKMMHASISRNHKTAMQMDEKLDSFNGLEFELLLLAMLTGLNLELTSGQITQNMGGLLTRLKLHKKNLSSKIRSAIIFLLSNDLIIYNQNGYVPSDRGRILGNDLLVLFKENYSII